MVTTFPSGVSEGLGEACADSIRSPPERTTLHLVEIDAAQVCIISTRILRPGLNGNGPPVDPASGVIGLGRNHSRS